ncbi:MAG: sulfatase [Planctomycetota bacterium]
MRTDLSTMRLSFLAHWLQLAIQIALCGMLAAQDDAHTIRRPNILFAMADDWGWPHAGALGDDVVATPNFDRIAREGVLFDHAFVSSPSCTPSRNAILTGQHFWRLGEGANLHSTLDVAHPTFIGALRDAGYLVGHWRKAWGPGDFRAGGHQSHPCGPARSFDAFLAERDPDQPFCFWLGSSDPHRDYVPGSGAGGGIDLAQIRVPGCWPDREVVRSDIADYYFAVQRWDRDVGAALELLQAKGLLEDTLVVVTGDHGMPFPRGKGNLYDRGARVPLAMRWRGIREPGRVDSAFVALTDLAPTFLAVAGIAIPPVMTGVSLLPRLIDPASDHPPRDFVIFGRERHVPAQAAPSLVGYPARAIRTADWLFVLNLEPDRWPAGVPAGATHPMRRFADCDDGPTKRLIADGAEDPELATFHSACFGKRPAHELYDCRRDPEQLRNLAADPDHAETLATLRDRLRRELRASGDPRFTTAEVKFDEFPYRAPYFQRPQPRKR